MNRLVAFAGVVIVMVTVFPSIDIPFTGESCGAFVADNIRGGLTCYHPTMRHCPYYAPHFCEEFPCVETILNDGENEDDYIWVCKGRNEYGVYIPIIIAASYGHSYVEFFADQEPGHNKPDWGAMVYCRLRKLCSSCTQRRSGNRPDCTYKGEHELADGRENWLFSGYCWEE